MYECVCVCLCAALTVLIGMLWYTCQSQAIGAQSTCQRVGQPADSHIMQHVSNQICHLLCTDWRKICVWCAFGRTTPSRRVANAAIFVVVVIFFVVMLFLSAFYQHFCLSSAVKRYVKSNC